MNLNLFRKPVFHLRSIVRGLKISTLFFVIATIVLFAGQFFYNKKMSENMLSEFETGLKKEMSDLKNNGDRIAQNKTLQDYILDNDAYRSLGLLSEESRKNGISAGLVTNADGIVITRIRTVSKRGDNVFVNTPQGRSLARGENPVSIENGSIDPSNVIMVTGRIIVRDGKNIGSLINAHVLDSEYAQKFRTKYLPKKSEVVFFTRDFGVYGSSFVNDTENDLLKSYFGNESDWIKANHPDQIIQFPNGRYYKVHQIFLTGLESSTTGALLFIPQYPFTTAGLIITLIASLLFFGFAVISHIIHRNSESRLYHFYWVSGLLSIIIFTGIIVLLKLPIIHNQKIRELPYTIYNSTVRLQPDSGTFSQDYEQKIGIIVDTGGEPINTIEVALDYNNQEITVEDIIMENSICGQILKKTINNESGTVLLSCIIPHPGFNKKTGTIAELLIKATKTGSFSIRFLPTTKILAHDGLATSVLRTVTNGSYRVINSNQPELLSLSSPTHPNKERWYNTKNITLLWKGPDQITYTLTSKSGTIISSGTTSEKALYLTVPVDGTYMFQVSSENNKNPTEWENNNQNYTFNIDTTSPEYIELGASETRVHKNDVVRFTANGSDSTSGLQNNYYLKINDGFLLPIGQQVFIPFTKKGINTVILRIFDNAGNITDTAKTIYVVDDSLLSRFFK